MSWSRFFFIITPLLGVNFPSLRGDYTLNNPVTSQQDDCLCWLPLAAAVATALDSAGIENPTMMMTTEDWHVFASAGSIFDSTQLDIDLAVVLELSAKLVALKDGASALGLEECAPE